MQGEDLFLVRPHCTNDLLPSALQMNVGRTCLHLLFHQFLVTPHTPQDQRHDRGTRSTAKRTSLCLNMLPLGILRKPNRNADKAPWSPATHQGETTTTTVRSMPNKHRNREPSPYPQSPCRLLQIENPPCSVCVYLSLWILSSLSPI